MRYTCTRPGRAARRRLGGRACHGKNGPTQNLSRGPNLAAIFGPGPNLAAVFGPMGQNLAARFRPRTKCGSHIWSYSTIILCGPTTWDQIWQPYSVLGRNLAAIFCPGTEFGSNNLS